MRCKIGYPYATSTPDKTKDSVVILEPTVYPGFNTIISNGDSYRLVSTDKGPFILNGFSKGVVGHLLESNDDRSSIAKQSGNIHGEGRSSQLAIILAACANYEEKVIDIDLPLILFSAAIDLPTGAVPFIDASINTYSDKLDHMRVCLERKYTAAKMANAAAIVIPKRDADILAECLGKNVARVSDMKNLGKDVTEPLIIGVGKSDLPNLATSIGISKWHYCSSPKQATILASVFFLFLISVGIFYLLNHEFVNIDSKVSTRNVDTEDSKRKNSNVQLPEVDNKISHSTEDSITKVNSDESLEALNKIAIRFEHDKNIKAPTKYYKLSPKINTLEGSPKIVMFEASANIEYLDSTDINRIRLTDEKSQVEYEVPIQSNEQVFLPVGKYKLFDNDYFKNNKIYKVSDENRVIKLSRKESYAFVKIKTDIRYIYKYMSDQKTQKDKEKTFRPIYTASVWLKSTNDQQNYKLSTNEESTKEVKPGVYKLSVETDHGNFECLEFVIESNVKQQKVTININLNGHLGEFVEEDVNETSNEDDNKVGKKNEPFYIKKEKVVYSKNNQKYDLEPVNQTGKGPRYQIQYEDGKHPFYKEISYANFWGTNNLVDEWSEFEILCDDNHKKGYKLYYLDLKNGNIQKEIDLNKEIRQLQIDIMNLLDDSANKDKVQFRLDICKKLSEIKDILFEQAENDPNILNLSSYIKLNVLINQEAFKPSIMQE